MVKTMERGIPVRVICRSIAALQLINRHGSLSAIEIARMLDLPYPTACRIIQTFLVEGMIESEPARKRYRATALVKTLSAGFQGEQNMLGAARPLLVDLTQRISWPVTLSTQVGQWMVVRESTHALSGLTFYNYDRGYSFPILESACGHAWLAFASDDRREHALNEIVELEGRSLTLSMFESGQLVERIQEDGYASHDRNRHSQSPGKTSALSVPVFENGLLSSVLTLTFFSTSMPMAEAVRRFIPEMKQVAANISERVSTGYGIRRPKISSHNLAAALALDAEMQQMG